jgi:hypothetical protein
LSGRESLRNGLIVLALLIGFGLITAVWPILAGATTTATTRVPAEAEVVNLTLPVVGDVALNSLQILGIMAGLVIGPIVVTGAIIGLIIVITSRQVTQVKEHRQEFDPERAGVFSVAYKPLGILNNFIRRSGEKYEGRKSHSAPAHVMPRWSIASTSLIILMFITFFGLVINGTFFPEGEVPWGNGQVIKSSWFTVGIPLLLALLVIFWRMRARLRAEAPVSPDGAAIPWDFIAVLITGLLIVGLGIGLIVYLNVPI